MIGIDGLGRRWAKVASGAIRLAAATLVKAALRASFGMILMIILGTAFGTYNIAIALEDRGGFIQK